MLRVTARSVPAPQYIAAYVVTYTLCNTLLLLARLGVWPRSCVPCKQIWGKNISHLSVRQLLALAFWSVAAQMAPELVGLSAFGFLHCMQALCITVFGHNDT